LIFTTKKYQQASSKLHHHHKNINNNINYIVMDRDVQQTLQEHVSKSEQILLQTQTRVKQFSKYVNSHSSTQSKLGFISSEITKQLVIIKRLIITLRGKTSDLVHDINTTRKSMELCIDELEKVLQHLKQKPLHSIFRTTTTSNIHPPTTTSSNIDKKEDKRSLFDFVNIESVSELQRRAQQEIIEMKVCVVF
jgi:hypothetical protein